MLYSWIAYFLILLTLTGGGNQVRFEVRKHFQGTLLRAGDIPIYLLNNHLYIAKFNPNFPAKYNLCRTDFSNNWKCAKESMGLIGKYPLVSTNDEGLIITNRLDSNGFTDIAIYNADLNIVKVYPSYGAYYNGTVYRFNSIKGVTAENTASKSMYSASWSLENDRMEEVATSLTVGKQYILVSYSGIVYLKNKYFDSNIRTVKVISANDNTLALSNFSEVSVLDISSGSKYHLSFPHTSMCITRNYLVLGDGKVIYIYDFKMRRVLEIKNAKGSSVCDSKSNSFATIDPYSSTLYIIK